MDNKSKKKTVIIVMILVIISILLYLLIRHFGNIENHGPGVPTGNIDIFEIDCNCDNCNGTENLKEKIQNDNNKYNSGNYDDSDANKNKIKTDKDGNIVVYDNYKIWDNKDLRIFSNPYFEYESKIAPGSSNSYAFVIKNNNKFDVVVDINMKETNPKNINMQYKLRNKGNYLIGSSKKYELINNKSLQNITIPAKSHISYILDWKWIDSDNDTEIGFDVTSNYKLSIQVGSNQSK